MVYWIAASMAAVLATLGLLFVPDRSGRSRAAEDGPALRPATWPRVSLIVPVAGIADCTETSLRSLLDQDYPTFEILWVTRDAEDDAVSLLRRLMREREESAAPPVRLVTSGPASRCGQKNHNLLAGVAAAAADTEVFVFADSTHEARPDWLRSLVAPISLGRTAVTTGYHHILPARATLPLLGRAVTVLALYRLQECRFITQPWGGNTAIARALFERLKVADTWADNVVDDVSLAMLLRQAGLRATPVREACLTTPLTDQDCSAWTRWLTRQWLYLKFCFPGSWAAAGVLLAVLAGFIVLAGLQALLLLTGANASLLNLASLAFLGGLAGIGLSLRRFHPRPGPVPYWPAAVAAAVFVAIWSHLRTWRAHEIRWKGVRYAVSGKGRVISVH